MPPFISQSNKALIASINSLDWEINYYMAKRFTDAQRQAALADLKDGMTLEQASKKHKCSTASLMQWKKTLGASAKAAVKRTSTKATGSSAIPSAHADRLLELEDENKFLEG